MLKIRDELNKRAKWNQFLIVINGILFVLNLIFEGSLIITLCMAAVFIFLILNIVMGIFLYKKLQGKEYEATTEKIQKEK